MSLTIGCATRPLAALPYQTVFKLVAESGYSDVAAFFDVGIDADAPMEHTASVRRAAADAALAPSMLIARADLDAGLPRAVRRYQRVIDHASMLGARWLLDMGTGDPTRYQAYLELMRAVTPYAARRGIGISLKPHGGLTLHARDLVRTHAEVAHPAFGISFDPGNIIYYTKGTERPERCVSLVAPLVTTAIIKDCIIRDGKPDVSITPGQGLVDFTEVIGGLRAGGFAGPLYVECVDGAEVHEIVANLRATREFVASILAATAPEE
jgi:sugar phosphate isomerase/epimerase